MIENRTRRKKHVSPALPPGAGKKMTTVTALNLSGRNSRFIGTPGNYENAQPERQNRRLRALHVNLDDNFHSGNAKQYLSCQPTQRYRGGEDDRGLDASMHR